MREPALTAEELHERVKAWRTRTVRGLDPPALEAWLLEHGFARRVPGGLTATRLGRELAETLALPARQP